jgi:hypothetical protein
MTIQTYIINLPPQTKRKQHMIQLMEKMSISNYEFVTPKIIQDTNLNQTKKAQKSLLETNKEIFQKVLNSSNPPPYILVFEDDVKPTIPEHKLMPKINRLINQVPDDWDMIYLEYCNETCFMSKKITHDLSRAVNPFCTAAILYNTKNLNKIIKMIETHHDYYAIDWIYKINIKNKLINAYISTPPLFVQDTNRFKSTIDNYFIRTIYGYTSCTTNRFIIHLIILTVIIGLCIYFIVV